MPNLKKRMQTIMRREGLTYQQVSEYADVSTQAVHKWLSTGSISDVKAREVAHQIGIDWIWLKHGINRVPVESLFDIVTSTTSNVVLFRWDTFELLAVGKSLQEKTEYGADELIGQSVMDFLPAIKKQLPVIRRGQKLLYALSGMVDYSYRATFQDKHTTKSMIIHGRGFTTDNEGNTYSLEELEEVEPSNLDDNPLSFRVHKKAAIPLQKPEIERLVSKFPEYPWLDDLLSE